MTAGSWRAAKALAVLGVVAFSMPWLGAQASKAPTAGAMPGVEARIDAIVQRMTIEQKVDMLGGTDGFYIRAIPEAGVPRLKMADGPFGVRNPASQSTAYASGISLASTWNPALAERVGVQIGRDSRARGVHFILGPGINISKAPMNGRNFEYFGEDPFLTGRITVGYITGVQTQGVSATVKHFFGNNSEYDRNNVDAIIDERTAREIYLPAFEAAVTEAKTGALMTSYNLVNGVHTSQLGAYNTDIVKKEWGFDGVIMSDWMSVYDGVAAANGGLDVEMPSGAMMNRATLLPAIKDGRVSVATIDDKVRRILRLAARMGWLDRDQVDLSVPAFNWQGAAVALETAREGMVLLKNAQAVLPFDTTRVRSVAVIGPIAHPGTPVGGGSAGVQPYRAVSSLEGIAAAFGPAVTVFHHRGVPTLTELADRTTYTTDAAGTTAGITVELYRGIALEGQPELVRVDPHVNIVGSYLPRRAGDGVYGDLSSARWSGYFTPTQAGRHHLFVHDFRGEGGCRASIDDRKVLDNWEVAKAMLEEVTIDLSASPHKVVLECYRRRVPGSTGVFARMGIVHDAAIVEAAATEIAKKADVVVATVGFDNQVESESGDRTFTLPVGQDRLIADLLAVNPKTVVVITSGGGVDMSAWIDRAPAAVMTWYAGQESGTALGQLLTGQANFTGHLPITIEKAIADNPSVAHYYPEPGTRRSEYREGLFVGYRGFEKRGTTPLFAFGHGLSYTSFAYGPVSVTAPTTAAGRAVATFTVTNTGTRAGAAVPQVYVGARASRVERAPKELRGFAKVALAPGASQQVRIELDPRAFSYWDVKTHAWVREAGTYDVLVGASSADIAQRASVDVR